jgi:hypothetical protein
MSSEREMQIDADLFARKVRQLEDWVRRAGNHLYANDADEGMRLVDGLWEVIKK